MRHPTRLPPYVPSILDFDHPIDKFLQAIVNLLQAKPKSTIKDVMYAIR